MSFDTMAGTHGARQPPGLALRWGNKLMARRIRRKGGPDLYGADLAGADLASANLARVLWSSGTLWPEDQAPLIQDRSEELRPGVWRIVGTIHAPPEARTKSAGQQRCT